MGRYFDTYSAAATLATPATEPSNTTDLSQQSQQSQRVGSDEFSGENIIDLRDAFEERAAIMEFDCGLSRADAERCATSDLAAQSGVSIREINRLTRLPHGGKHNGRT